MGRPTKSGEAQAVASAAHLSKQKLAAASRRRVSNRRSITISAHSREYQPLSARVHFFGDCGSDVILFLSQAPRLFGGAAATAAAASDPGRAGPAAVASCDEPPGDQPELESQRQGARVRAEWRAGGS